MPLAVNVMLNLSNISIVLCEGRRGRGEGRGERGEGDVECWSFFWSQLFLSRTVIRFSLQHIGHLEEKNNLQKTGIMRPWYCSLDYSDVGFHNGKKKD